MIVAERRVAARGVELEADITPGVQATFDPEAHGDRDLQPDRERPQVRAGGSRQRLASGSRLERGEAVLEVEDNGVGIAAGELEIDLQAVLPRERRGHPADPGHRDRALRRARDRRGARRQADGGEPRPGAGRDASGWRCPGAEALPEDEFSEYSDGQRNEVRPWRVAS